MSQTTGSYIEYTCSGGDTWDNIALSAYNEERMSTLLIDANRDYIDTLIFEGGEVIKVPIVEESDVSTTDTLPPWMTSSDEETDDEA